MPEGKLPAEGDLPGGAFPFGAESAAEVLFKTFSVSGGKKRGFQKNGIIVIFIDIGAGNITVYWYRCYALE